MSRTITLALVVVCLLATLSVGVGANEWCYQEQSNESVLCGGLATGSYGWKCQQFTEPVAQYDGNWSTYSQGAMQEDCGVYYNYTKPVGALNSSIWQVKDYLNGIMNVSIPQSCWDANQNTLAFGSFTYTGLWWACWNGTQYIGIASAPPFERRVFEEAMWWDLCSPEWICSGYGNCLPNNTQPCNATTDNNSCGLNYTGNYSEFSPQECDFCVPSWVCSDYGECQPDDNQYCNETTDESNCGETYTGNYSEFEPQICAFCVPYWVCDGYSEECVNESRACNSANDTNICGELYEGNYSEFEGALCEHNISGYTPLFAKGDIVPLTIDTIGGFLTTTTSYMWLIIIVIIIGILLVAMRGR